MEPDTNTTRLRTAQVIRCPAVGRGLLARYRRAGADPPFGDPARDHGARFEGYYWRMTDADRVEGVGEGSERELRLELGPDATLEVELRNLVGWPRPALGGSGPAQLLPGLPQYWHPWAMGGVAAGEARIGGEPVSLDG